jgi:HTH-type transcriptional regulator/antitoxin HipB
MMGFNRHPMPIDPNHIRIRIRRMREMRHMTQAQLGKKVGMSQAAISYIERGWRLITLRRLISFAKALGVTVEWLVHAPEEDLLD